MRLLLSVPTGIVLDTRVTKVSSESDRGAFTILPRHADGAMVLRPGLLSYVGEENGAEKFVVIDEGVLVKADRDLRVACRRAVVAGGLHDARAALAEYLHGQSEHERKAKAVLMTLEAEVLRRLGELR